jgi:hypothetical protein
LTYLRSYRTTARAAASGANPTNPGRSPTRRSTKVVLAIGVCATALFGALVGSQPGEASSRGCRVDVKSIRAVGCSLAVQDTAASADPLPLWHQISCVAGSRHVHKSQGGDPRRTALGDRQRNQAYRSLRVVDGDYWWGERCELGYNWRDETVETYYAGQRRITFASIRLRKSFPADATTFQSVLQMKQVQPADNAGGGAVLALNVFGGKWRLVQVDSGGINGRTLFSARARKGRWTRIALDVTYSDDPDAGSVRAYIDANGDGDVADRGERSGLIRTYTLKRETATDVSDGLLDDGIAEGEPIPSHLRLGLYHDEGIRCPGPKGCRIDFDNVQVVGPR